MTRDKYLSLLMIMVSLTVKLSESQVVETTTLTMTTPKVNKTTTTAANVNITTTTPKDYEDLDLEDHEHATEKWDPPAEFVEGYVLDEPVGTECVKWGFYQFQKQSDAIRDFRLKWEIDSPKGFLEKCDELKKNGECAYPLKCINGECKCTYLWDEKRKLCVLPAGWIPPQGNPGCTEDNDCVDFADCFFQTPCHCTPNCEIVYGICWCKSPIPPRGFRDGDCAMAIMKDQNTKTITNST